SGTGLVWVQTLAILEGQGARLVRQGCQRLHRTRGGIHATQIQVMRGDGRAPVESTGNCVPVTEIARSVAAHGVVDLIGGLGSTADVHGVRAVVETVVAGRDGRVIAVHAGAVPTLDEEDKLKVRP